MIRGLALILGLLLGLATAAAVYGRMAHLRALTQPPLALPLVLPGWTGAVVPEAGLMSGTARDPSGAVLAWRLAGFDSRGPLWALQAEGAGLTLTLEARLGPGPALVLEGAAGQAALTGPQVSGHFTLTGGSGRLDAAGLTLELSAMGRRLRLEGAEQPDARASLTLSADGGWRLDLGERHLEGADLASLLGE